MGTLGVHQNIPASVTKLTHRFHIYSIGIPLVMDKLIIVTRERSRVHRRWAPCLVSITSLQSTLNQGIIVTHTDHLSRNKTFNWQRQMHVQPINCIVSTPDTSPRQHTYISSETAVQLTRCFRSTLLLTQKLGIPCAIEMAIKSDE